MIYNQEDYYPHSDWYLFSRRLLKKSNQEWAEFSIEFAVILFLCGIGFGIVIGAWIA